MNTLTYTVKQSQHFFILTAHSDYVLMPLKMAHIKELDNKIASADPVADPAERTAFIGGFVRQDIKDYLKAEGATLERPLTWVFNRILEDYVTTRKADDGNTTQQQQ